MKYTGLSDDVIGRSKLKGGSNNREFELVRCVCHVLVERCWGQVHGQGLQAQGERETPISFFLNRLSLLKYLNCLLYSCK